MDTCPTHKERVSQSPVWATDRSTAPGYSSHDFQQEIIAPNRAVEI